MHLQDLLSHPDIQLPLSWDDKNGKYDFQGFIQERFDRFCGLLSKLDDGPIARIVKARKPAIEKCGANIVASVEHSLNGRVYEAVEQLKVAVEEVLDELSRQEGQWNIGELLLYRVRHTSLPRLRPEQLFHIPFEERYKVPPHRYSILGLPCLYLSGSLYTCWEEMGRPPFHELQVAAFWLKKTVNVLHLTAIPSLLLQWVDGNDVVERNGVSRKFLEGWISCGLVLWSLMASSSVIVRHRNSPFKPEYLVPQMLLQWVRKSSKFDGIAYASTNVRATSPEYAHAVWNYVFPAKVIRPAGWCEHLCGLFKMTQPYGWELLRAAQVGDRVDAVAAKWFRIELIEGFEKQYALSEFGEIEAKLRKLVETIKATNSSGHPDVGDIRSRV